MAPKTEFTSNELDLVTNVFHQYETGLREAAISSKDLYAAMTGLGLNLMEHEVVDLTNEVAVDGLVYFPEFCKIVLRKFREDDEDQFMQITFKVFYVL